MEALDMIEALGLLTKYNPGAKLTATKEQEYQADVIVQGGRYTGHKMAEHEEDRMNQLGWFPSIDTCEGDEDNGTWECTLYRPDSK